MRTRLESIEISFFKSFIGRYKLTPLMPWNAIEAPNGSGKSSLIDAITFGLGENDHSQLRINDLSELIPQIITPRAQCICDLTWVAVTISSGEDSTVFRRILTKSNAQLLYESLYVVNDEVVEVNDYLDRLKNYGINIKAKDFVVYQGNINDIIGASPQDRSRMLEIASGSIKFKETYDNLARDLATIRESIVVDTAEQKRLNRDIRKWKEVKKQTEEYLERRSQFPDQLRQSYLLQLKINDLQNEALGADVPPVNQSSKIHEAEEESPAVEKMLKKQAACRAQLNKQTEKLKELTAQQQKKNDLMSIHQMEMQKLQKWLHDEENLRSAIIDLEQGIQDNEQLYKQHVQKDIEHYKLVSENEDEYHRLQSEVQRQIDVALAENESTIHIRKFDRELNYWKKQWECLEKGKIDHQNYINNNEKSLDKYEHDLKVIRKEIEILGKEKEEKSSLLLSEDKITEYETRKQEIENQLEIHEVSLENAQSKETKKETLKKLRAKFPGHVYDRIYNLCSVPDDRYKVAMAAALNKNLNAIIVQDNATAIACLAYLEQEKMGFETFYSIGGVRPPSLDRNVPSRLNPINVKLVYDILKFDDQFEPVIRNIVKSNVLCKTLDDAWIAMDKMKSMKRMHNVVTMAGEILTTKFLVSGGFAERKNQSEKINTDTQSKLQKEKKKIVEKLANVHNESFKVEVQVIEDKYQFKLRCQSNLETSIVEIKAKNNTLQNELKELEKQQQIIKAKELDVKKQRDEIDLKRQQMQQQVDELRRSTFQNFCAKLHITEIGEFEKMLESRNKQTETLTIIENNLKQLRSQKKNDESTSKANEVPKWKAKLKDLKESELKLQLNFEKLNEKREEINSSINKLETIFNKEETMLKATQLKRKEALTSEHRNCKKIIRASRLREELATKRQEILSAARLANVSLPEVQGNSSSSSSSQSSVEDNQKKFDFSCLKELQTSTDVSHLEAKLSMLEERLDQSRLDLDQYEMPERHTGETLKALKKELKEVAERVKQMKKQELQLLVEFNKVQQNRSEAFTQFFDKASSAIDNICKRINNNMSAQALLIAEHPTEPYLDGILYDCFPAHKKFRTGEQLSGGEKAMAGLTFLFALQESRSSSLIILDEVDGSLDPKFVEGLTNYLKILKNRHQIFMISHNHMINSGADEIICVTPDVSSTELMSYPMMVYLDSKFRGRQRSQDNEP